MIAQVSSSSGGKQSPSVPYSPLKYQRLLRGWSQQDLVDAISQYCINSGRSEVGLTTDTVSRWENGHNRPSPIYRKHLCQLYNMTADQLGFIETQEVQA